MSIDRSGVVTQEMLVRNFNSVADHRTVVDAARSVVASVLAPGVRTFRGTSVTRAAVLAELGATPPVGSIYFGPDRVYLRIAAAAAAADWQKVTTSAAD